MYVVADPQRQITQSACTLVVQHTNILTIMHSSVHALICASYAWITCTCMFRNYFKHHGDYGRSEANQFRSHTISLGTHMSLRGLLQHGSLTWLLPAPSCP